VFSASGPLSNHQVHVGHGHYNSTRRNLQSVFENEEQNCYRESSSESSGMRSVHFPFGGSHKSSSPSITEALGDTKTRTMKENHKSLDSHPQDDAPFPIIQSEKTIASLSPREHETPQLQRHLSYPSAPEPRLIKCSVPYNNSQTSRSCTYHSWSNQSKTYPYFDGKRCGSFSKMSGIKLLSNGASLQSKLHSDHFQSRFSAMKSGDLSNHSHLITSSDENLPLTSRHKHENTNEMVLTQREMKYSKASNTGPTIGKEVCMGKFD